MNLTQSRRSILGLALLAPLALKAFLLKDKVTPFSLRSARRAPAPWETRPLVALTPDLEQDFIDFVRQGHFEGVSILLKIGMSPNVKDREDLETPALSVAALEGHVQIAQLLIQAGADVNARDLMGRTALFEAASFNRVDILQLLLQSGAAPHLEDAQGFTARLVARYRGHQHAAALLERNSRPA